MNLKVFILMFVTTVLFIAVGSLIFIASPLGDKLVEYFERKKSFLYAANKKQKIR